jgi:hypothetical protein
VSPATRPDLPPPQGLVPPDRDPPKLVRLDGRRRTSLARIGRKGDFFYLAEELADGTVVLTPAAVVPAGSLRAREGAEGFG